MVGYIPRWFTCQQIVSHPGSNRVQCSKYLLVSINEVTIVVTSLIETKRLTTTPRHHGATHFGGFAGVQTLRPISRRRTVVGAFLL